MFVIVYGGLADGIEGVVGPFKTEDAAEEYAESHNLGHPDSKIPIDLEMPAEHAELWKGKTVSELPRPIFVAINCPPSVGLGAAVGPFPTANAADDYASRRFDRGTYVATVIGKPAR